MVRWCFIVSSLIILFENIAFAQPTYISDPILDELRSQTIELSDTPIAELDDNILDILNPVCSARIIGVGEATHGTRDFFQMKARIFKHLVIHHGFRCLAMEMDFSGSIPIDNYICNNQGDLTALMNQYMQIWVHRNNSLYELLQWIHDYNLSRSVNEKIHFVGIDAQLQTFNASIFKNFIKVTDPAGQLNFQDEIVWMQQLANLDPRQVDQALKSDQIRRLQSIAVRLSEHKTSLIKTTNNWEFQSAVQVVNTARQSVEFLHAYFQKNQLIRDRYLAENILWLTRILPAENGIMIWSHNAHVFRDPDYTPDAGGSMGFLLGQQLKKDYRVIGMGFSKGRFRAKVKVGKDISQLPVVCSLTDDPPENALNTLFYQAKISRGILPIMRLSPESLLGKVLKLPRPLLGIGDLFFPDEVEKIHYELDRIIIPSTYLDLYIYLDNTEPSLPIPKTLDSMR